MNRPTLAIFHNNFTKFDFYKFRLNKIKKKYNIIYVNLSFLLNYKKKNLNKFSKKNYYYIYSIFELYNFLKQKKNFYVLDLLGISFNFKKSLIRILINRHVNGVLPVIGLRYRISNKYFSSSFKENIIKITNFLTKIIFKKIIFQNYFVILSGKYRENFYSNLTKKKPLYTFSADYQRYVDIKKHYRSKKKYAVFLEEKLVDHPDYYNSSQGIPPLNKKKYYAYMNNFFSKFKNRFKCDIIIAIHPKSTKQEIQKNFKNYKIFKGNTQNLIKNSTSVIGHASTSISYPVLFNKPLFFLSFSSIKRHFVGKEITLSSKLLGSKLIYIDEKFDLNNLKFKINKLKYNSYFKNFLKHPKSKNRSFDDIFRDYL